MTGVQIFAVGMFSTLVNQFSLLNLPGWVFGLGEVCTDLSRSDGGFDFSRAQCRPHEPEFEDAARRSQTAFRSKQIEQERRAAELRAENERRAKEFEEARQLQLSMLPKKLPQHSNLEIAAYMKPATEVGGDYYDFHVGEDGTLTVAVGDATGHGLESRNGRHGDEKFI